MGALDRMVRGGIGIEELGKLKFWQLVFSEGLGTMLIVMLNNMHLSRHDGSSVLINTSIVAGLVYTVALFMLGNHGYFNPAITISLCIVQRIPIVRMSLYVLSQVAGATAGQAFVRHLVLGDGYSGTPVPAEDVTLFQLFLVEMLGMSLVSAVISTHCSAGVTGLAVTLASVLMFPSSMACINPARSFAGYAIAAKFPAHSWVYLLAPVVGAMVGRIVMFGIEKVKVVDIPEIEGANSRLLSDSE